MALRCCHYEISKFNFFGRYVKMGSYTACALAWFTTTVSCSLMLWRMTERVMVRVRKMQVEFLKSTCIDNALEEMQKQRKDLAVDIIILHPKCQRMIASIVLKMRIFHNCKGFGDNDSDAGYQKEHFTFLRHFPYLPIGALRNG